MQSSTADLHFCRELLRGGSRTFFAASFLLPPRVRKPATALYAFCRLADDAVDLSDKPSAALRMFRQRLSRIYAGEPDDHPVDRAFCNVVHEFGVPEEVPHALLEGLQWDLESRTYETIDDLCGYAVRVAGTVGVMMAVLMGVRIREQLSRACDLGIAMQLTNIARDVGEDARNGRMYLPSNWVREAGVDPDKWIKAPEYCPQLAEVVERLLAYAEGLYDSAKVGVEALPRSCRPGIESARILYREIGRKIIRDGLNVVERRSVVGPRRKAVLVAGALSGRDRTTGSKGASTAALGSFLADAVVRTQPIGSGRTSSHEWWDIHAGAVAALDLCLQLELRDRAATQSGLHNNDDDLFQNSSICAERS